MNISVDGWRASLSDWEAVRNLPQEQLPSLTPEQREVARKLRISVEDYARSVLAGRRTTESLLAKTTRFARLLQERVRNRAAQADVESVALRTFEHRFDIELKLDGAVLPLRVDENIVDDLFESGSADAEQRLTRILDLALQARVL